MWSRSEDRRTDRFLERGAYRFVEGVVPNDYLIADPSRPSTRFRLLPTFFMAFFTLAADFPLLLAS
jgi:hypothetical protein